MADCFVAEEGEGKGGRHIGENPMTCPDCMGPGCDGEGNPCWNCDGTMKPDTGMLRTCPKPGPFDPPAIEEPKPNPTHITCGFWWGADHRRAFCVNMKPTLLAGFVWCYDAAGKVIYTSNTQYGFCTGLLNPDVTRCYYQGTYGTYETCTANRRTGPSCGNGLCECGETGCALDCP